MAKTALITGGHGFLGRACARKFKALGHRVVGVGHGFWTPEQALSHGFDDWRTGDISLEGLAPLDEPWDVVLHCASNGSVATSIHQPHESFQRTVESTACLLEHLRRQRCSPVLIYPSSAAVYGTADDRPLQETDPSRPVSPYGFHKRMTEDLLESEARQLGLRVGIIRFFSIYGAGLQRQLLWDAAEKLRGDPPSCTFWGTGNETRDWIHVDDAAALMAAFSKSCPSFKVVNGGSGERVTVSQVLHQLRDALGGSTRLEFNGAVKEGDPRHYHADTRQAQALGWQPSISLSQGLRDYAQWVRVSNQSDGETLAAMPVPSRKS
jgi:UDP-glucose 4-epimerase